VHELGAELERYRQIRLVSRENAAADAVACFEHAHALAPLRDFRRGREAGGAGADHGDVEALAHPLRSAVTGSTRAARIAGIEPAPAVSSRSPFIVSFPLAPQPSVPRAAVERRPASIVPSVLLRRAWSALNASS
jgi:hypothetical protein